MLPSGTTSGCGQSVKSLGDPVAGRNSQGAWEEGAPGPQYPYAKVPLEGRHHHGEPFAHERPHSRRHVPRARASALSLPASLLAEALLRAAPKR